MKIVTKRSIILGVAKHWKLNYPDESILYGGKSSKDIHEALEALDKTKATEKDVVKIIGNKFWTSLKCTECKKEVEECIQIEQDVEGYDGSVFLCSKCLEKAGKMMKPYAP